MHSVDDAEAIRIQNENDIKALFKDFKRVARSQKLERQLAAAQELLLNARRWTAPFKAASPLQPRYPAADPVAPAAGAAVVAPALCAGVTTAVAVQPDHKPGAAGGGYKPCSSSGSSSGSAVKQGQGPDRPSPRSHPLSREPSCCSQGEGYDGVVPCSSGGRDSPGDGGAACAGNPSRHRTVVSAALAAADGAAAPAAAASDVAPTAVAVAGSSRGVNFDEQPAALRSLRTASCGVNTLVKTTCSTTIDAATPPLLGDGFTPSTSLCSSAVASSAVTPIRPSTPRCASPGPFAAAAADSSAAAEAIAGAVAAAALAACGGANSEPVGCPGSPATADGGSDGSGEGVLVVCCSIDLEWWERDNSRVTEIGWTMWDNLTRRLVSRHHIVAENEALVNRIYVPDHKRDFLFGRSTTGSLAWGAAALQSDLDWYGERVWAWWQQRGQQCQPQRREPQPQQQPQQEERKVASQQQAVAQGSSVAAGAAMHDGRRPAWRDVAAGGAAAGGLRAAASASSGSSAATSGSAAGAAETAAAAASDADMPQPLNGIQVVVVGHGLSQDLKALSELLGVALPAEAAVLDTADLAWAALEAAPGQERTAMSLRVLLKTLGIPATKLHNGGNDARYTMEALLALAALEPRQLGAPGGDVPSGQAQTGPVVK